MSSASASRAGAGAVGAAAGLPASSARGVKRSPSIARSSADSVPRRVRAASPAGSPDSTVSPSIRSIEIRPRSTATRTRSRSSPASGSDTEIRLPPVPEKTSAVSSVTVCAGGTMFTGASSTAPTSITTTARFDSVSPLRIR